MARRQDPGGVSRRRTAPRARESVPPAPLRPQGRTGCPPLGGLGRQAEVRGDHAGELFVRLVGGVAEVLGLPVDLRVEVVEEVGEAVRIVQRALEDLPALPDQPAAEEVEGVVARAAQQYGGGAPQIPAVRAVETGLEVPGEIQHGFGIEQHQPFDEQIGLVLGVALGGLAGAVDDLPELRLVHHGSSIGLGGLRCTRTRRKGPLSDRGRAGVRRPRRTGSAGRPARGLPTPVRGRAVGCTRYRGTRPAE